MKSDQAVTDRAVAQYRGARNQKPGGRNLCGAMVQLHPAHIMVGVVLHTLLRRWTFTKTGGLATFISSTLFSPPSISCVDVERSIAPARQPRSQPHDGKADSGAHTSPASRAGSSFRPLE